jgi:hypothetical protein
MTKTVRMMGGKRRSLKRTGRKIVNGKRSKAVRKNGSRRRIRMIRGGGEGEGEGKNVLLIIDPQRDFMDIIETFKKQKGTVPFKQTSESGGLPVPGAVKDMNALITFLDYYPDAFSEIHVSLDSHTDNHIGHINFWTPDSKPTDYVSPIPLETFYIKDAPIEGNDAYDTHKIYVGTWNGEPKSPEQRAYARLPILQKFAYFYIKKMNIPEKPKPCLWAKHCISGTDGWRLYFTLEKKLIELQKKGKKVYYHEKGTNDLVEMYSIFSAEVPFEELLNDTGLSVNDLPEEYKKYVNATLPKPSETNDKNNETPNYVTGFNQTLFNKLMEHDKIFVCGEAKSHCVKTSLEDMVAHCKESQCGKIHVLENMTSVVPGYEDPTVVAYKQLSSKGIKIINATIPQMEKNKIIDDLVNDIISQQTTPQPVEPTI